MNHLKKILLILIFGATVLACNNNDDEIPPASTANYVVATTSGVFPTQTSYLQSISSLDISGVLQNSDAKEANGPVAAIASSGSHIFVGLFGEPARLYKYRVNNDQTFTEEGVIQVDGAMTFSGLHLENENEGYFHTFGVDKIFKFNPTSFSITGEIDLDPLQKEDLMMLKSSIVKRGNKLYVGVDFKDYAEFESILDAAYVVVADLTTNTAALISDERTKIIDGNPNALPVLVKDDQNNIYVQGWGEDGNLPGGILRIKNGEDTFDPTYFFDISEATSTTSILGVNYIGGNQAILAAQTGQGNNFFDPVFSFFKIDLQTKTVNKVAGLPETKAYSASKLLKLDDNTFLFPINTASENSIYEYSLSDGTVKKKFSTADPIAAILSVNK